VASKFDQALGSARGRNVGLRIKIHLDPDDADIAALSALPWELLSHKDMGGQALTLSGDTPIVRCLDSPVPGNFKPITGPLRVLVIVSNPIGVEPLDLEQEKASIREHWAQRDKVDVHFLAQATVDALGKELLEQEYHVVHFMGHGDFDEQNGVGVLLMETENGEQDPVDGKTLGVLLHNAKSVRLVFLNACNTAKLNNIPGKDPYAGVAAALVLNGVPAVIAMQFPVSDSAAILFADRLYDGLSKGLRLEGAVSEARTAIRTAQRNALEWATPVVFMSINNIDLFPANNTESKNTAANKRNVLIGCAAFVLIAGIIVAMNIRPSYTAIEGKIIDQTINSVVSNAEVTVENLDGQSITTTTDSQGVFALQIPESALAGIEKVAVRYVADGYKSNKESIPLPGSNANAYPFEILAVPENLEQCSGKMGRVVTVGNFSDARDGTTIRNTFKKNLERSILIKLGEKHLNPNHKPAFTTCTEAQPESPSYTSGFAKTLGTDVFLHGEVSGGQSNYTVTTFLGDKHDLFNGDINSGQSKDLTDPKFAKLDNATQRNVLLALARSYADDKKYSSCITAAQVALEFSATNSDDIEQQLDYCEKSNDHAAMMPSNQDTENEQ
ncbi:MAG: CHAT domain-containing protein, partial [Pseudomonadales bacterium]